MVDILNSFTLQPIRLLSVAALLMGTALPVDALPLTNGRHAFDRAPRLTGVTTAYNQTVVPNYYHFTITIPSDAGAAMQAVSVTQSGNFEAITFAPDESRAYEGESFRGGRDIPLANVIDSGSDEAGVVVTFAEPVQPGTTITVVLSARSPALDGLYRLGVRAHPVGENSPELFLGYGRLNFRRNPTS